MALAACLVQLLWLWAAGEGKPKAATIFEAPASDPNAYADLIPEEANATGVAVDDPFEEAASNAAPVDGDPVADVVTEPDIGAEPEPEAEPVAAQDEPMVEAETPTLE